MLPNSKYIQAGRIRLFDSFKQLCQRLRTLAGASRVRTYGGGGKAIDSYLHSGLGVAGLGCLLALRPRGQLKLTSGRSIPPAGAGYAGLVKGPAGKFGDGAP